MVPSKNQTRPNPYEQDYTIILSVLLGSFSDDFLDGVLVGEG